MTIIRQKTKRQQRNEGLAIIAVLMVLVVATVIGVSLDDVLVWLG